MNSSCIYEVLSNMETHLKSKVNPKIFRIILLVSAIALILTLTLLLTSCNGTELLGINGNNTDNDNATLGERNALREARNYLRAMAFSREKLIDQLQYEGYSLSESTYAVDHCDVDWYEQAAKKAREYLDVMPFSRQKLIEQLEYEKFTHDQAVYGAEAVGY